MHFHVLIALDTLEYDIMKQIAERMAPFDENKQVDPWRDYATGDPINHWFVQWVQRSAAHLRDGTGLKTYVPGYRGLSSHSSGKTHGQQRAEFAKDAEIARRLAGNALGWRNIVQFHNERFPDDEPLYFDEQTGRAYEIKDTNPNAKWDYWSLRKDGDHFVTKHVDRKVSDFGFIADLDIDAMRRTAAADAENRYKRGETHNGDGPLTITDYVDHHAAAAVPTSQFLTIDGEWIERPWAFRSTPSEVHAYNVRVNEYIDRMEPMNALALVTYHT